MKRTVFIILFFGITKLASFSQNTKQVCFTLDDLPFVDYGNNDSSFYSKAFHSIVEKLCANKVPAIGFLNENKLFKNDSLQHFKFDLLTYWTNKGLQLGNHTYSHINLNEVSLSEYGADVLKGAKLTSHLLTVENGKYYFRHPYLQTGANKAIADSLQQFLNTHNYIVAPVTIDNHDYLFANAYQKVWLLGDSVQIKQIEKDYIQYMNAVLVYYEKQTERLFKRPIKHILLLHNNLLNANTLDDLIALYKTNNYQFIPLSEALKDAIYQTPITVYEKWGISWIDRWALSKKVNKNFFKDEPQVPAYIWKLNK